MEMKCDICNLLTVMAESHICHPWKYQNASFSQSLESHNQSGLDLFVKPDRCKDPDSTRSSCQAVKVALQAHHPLRPVLFVLHYTRASVPASHFRDLQRQRRRCTETLPNKGLAACDIRFGHIYTLAFR